MGISFNAFIYAMDWYAIFAYKQVQTKIEVLWHSSEGEFTGSAPDINL